MDLLDLILDRSKVVGKKYITDTRSPFRKAKEITSKGPTILISNGAPNYNQDFRINVYL